MSLLVTTPELWPINAAKILKDKNISVEYLKCNFTEIFFPWDEEYSSKRTYFSLIIQQRPLFIVTINHISEIEKILNYVETYSLTIRVMNGRHSSQLLNPEVIVDVSKLKDISFDGDIVTIQTGVTQGLINDFLFKQDPAHYCHLGHYKHPKVDAFPGGSAVTVSSIITTMGGVGVLPRTYGLTIDSCLEYTITIPPNGRRGSKTVKANCHHRKDLFYALRGGGGNNFGIVNSVSLKIIKVPEIIRYTLTWNENTWNEKNIKQILDIWKRTSISLPNEFNEEIGISINSNGTNISLVGYYVMKNERCKLEDRISTLNIYNAVINVNKISYDKLYTELVVDRTYYNFSSIQTFFIDNFDSKKIASFMNTSVNNDGFTAISFQLLGGAIRDVPLNSTAFYPRDANFFMDVATLWNDEQNTLTRQEWVHDIDRYVLKNDNKSDKNIQYVGFPNPFLDLNKNNDIYYGKHYKKLREIKKNIDPLNILTPTGTIN